MREDNRIEVVRNRLASSVRRISWSAIFAGVFVTLGVSLLLTLLGTGLGAGSINPTQASNPFSGLGIVAIIWTIVSGFIAFFIGGWVAGNGAGWVGRREALIHGFVTWSVASIAAVWLITGAAGSMLSGGAGLIGQTISGSAKAAAQSPQVSARIREELEKRGIDLNALEQQAQSPETQANAAQTARQAGEKVAKGVSMVGLGGFGLLIIDLIASLAGAVTVARREPAEVATTERVA
jgi:hypothetical protein